METLYTHTEVVHNYQAAREVVPLLLRLTSVKNVIDVGCGIGTWLKVFEENGIDDYIGVDGEYVDTNLLKIPSSKFFSKDLRRDWTVNRKFDIALCLEVAEHLPESASDLFVENLARLSDVIIFSAAIPGQGGQNHLNEQWPEYWQHKFAQYDFYFHDLIRPLIWNNEKIEWWYRQNIFVLKKNTPAIEASTPLAIVHPKLLEKKDKDYSAFFDSVMSGRQGVKMAIRVFVRAILFKVKSIFHGR